MTPTNLKTLPIKEEDIQAAIIQLFTALGFDVFQASRRGVKTAQGRVYGADGVDKRVPDLYIRWKTWPRGMQLALEVKRPKGWEWSNPQQKEAWISGATAKVHSVDQAIATVFEFWQRAGLGPVSGGLFACHLGIVAEHGFYEEPKC